MAKVNSLLAQRLKRATETLSKMTSLAELTTTGNLSSFSGVFRVTPLSSHEQESLQQILNQFSQENQETKQDLVSLISITSEVKAINTQAAILHGERIKRAQDILKKYQDGAFSAWLILSYGNRQTPYNFLQYFELYNVLPKTLQTKVDGMPKQAVYTLASRGGAHEKKEEIIKNYQGESKQELLILIRETFPLDQTDKRAQDLAQVLITQLKRLIKTTDQHKFRPNKSQKEELSKLLDSFHMLIHDSR